MKDNGQSEQYKQQVGEYAMRWVQDDMIVGVGTGSTVHYFIEALAKEKGRIQGAVASSFATEQALRVHGVPLLDLNSVPALSLYVDGADQVNGLGQLIKGGGGALTREKILAAAASQFLCIVDESKSAGPFGEHPVPMEVLAMARSLVGRACVTLGGHPVYREGFQTDNGHIILDVDFGVIESPIELEQQLNGLPGVVANGLFATRAADTLVVAGKHGIRCQTLG